MYKNLIQNISKILFFTCIIGIEYLATTSKSFEVVEKSWDKANHFVAFFVLYILLTLAYKRLNISYKILILLLFAIQIEIVQYFLPYRSFSLLDIFADGVGIGLGIFMVKFLRKNNFFKIAF